MPRSKRELFDKIRDFWLDAVRLRVKLGMDSNTSPFGIYEQVEKSISNEEEITKLANWAFCQSIENDMNVSGVSIDKFDQMMKNNLSDESWSDERVAYERLPMIFPR